MEMPVDVLTHRLGKLRDNLMLDGDYTAYAISIDEELQRKFVMIPYEEIENVLIENSKDGHGFYAGSGPETIRAGEHDNPNWLYNSALHALAMWQHLSRLQERKAEEEKLAKRPEPGVYQGKLKREDDEPYFIVIVDKERRMWVPQDQGGLLDLADQYDRGEWEVQHIDITDGTISA